MIELQNKSPKILVIGDIMIDHYLWGSCERISPEAPVQIIDIDKENVKLGGAGNVINNLMSLGAQPDIISVIGDNETSDELKYLLQSIGVKSKYLFIQKDRLTSKKTRIISSQQQVVRYDQESSTPISSESEKLILKTFTKIIANYDIILFSDYGKGVLCNKLTRKLISIAKSNEKKVLVDPKGLDYSKYKGAFLLTPNKKEASEATQIKINDKVSLEKAIKKLKIKYELNTSLITLSEQGVAIYDKKLRVYPTAVREVFDVTGAGDTILASLGFALACNINIDEAVKFANLAAGVVVGKIGSSTVTLNEIIEYESSINKSSSDQHIRTLNEITKISIELQIKQKRIIFTNGCFDLLHSGHVKYLERAKSFGDILIVGINSDRSVKALKGQGRPVNKENDRAYILAALEVVDFVVIFDEDTPYNLIKSIKPNILVKGGDYKGKEIVGDNLVEQLKIVDYIKDKSTSKTIHKIQTSKYETSN
jgi:D-beta-D-heptose 7-phosphate kinase / D-beta-D-heptose 1-phosphate adenosyltransferase